MERLRVPELNHYQLQVEYQALINEEPLNVESSLNSVTGQVKQQDVLTWTQDFTGKRSEVGVLEKERGQRVLSYLDFVRDIAKTSFTGVSLDSLASYAEIFKNLYEQITYEDEGVHYLSSSYIYSELLDSIRKSFIPKRSLKKKEEFIEGNAALLDKLFFFLQ